MSAARTHAGLSLVELLVVIVLVALTTTLVMQGIGQGLGMFRRVSADQGTLYRELMGRQWLRESIAAAVASAPDRSDFRGEPQALALRSFRPLLGPEGIASAIEWSVRTGRGLDYHEDTQQLEVDSLPEALRFEYQDAAATWHPRWPPADSTQLPERVRVVFADGEMLDIALLTQRTLPADSDESMIDEE